MKIAIPVAEGKLCMHFGHCQQFAVVEVENEEIKNKEMLTPPAHEPGVLPQWLNEVGAKVVIAGGMGGRAIQFFDQYGIRVIVGAPSLDPEQVVEQYLAGTLETGGNVCDH